MARKLEGLSFKDLEVLCCASLGDKMFIATAPTDEDLRLAMKIYGFGDRYGGASKKKLEACTKELDKLVGPSPDKQDAVASTCFVLDSLSALEKHK